MVWINGLVGMVWTSALWSPKYYWAGFGIGAFYGFMTFHMIYNLNNSKNTEGFEIQFDNGMTQEER